MVWSSTDRMTLTALSLAFGVALAWNAQGAGDAGRPPLPSLEIDANTVPIEVLGALPGLGPSLSSRIVAAREIRPFASMDDLDRRVKGIGPAKALAIRPYLRFDPVPVPPR